MNANVAQQQPSPEAAIEGECDANRMEITPAEESWAYSIKGAIEDDPELDNLPDFWYAQLAIVGKDDLQQALDQARSMQYFRQEYDIRDTLEDARRTVQEFLELFPNWILSFHYCKELSSYFWVVDITAIDIKLLQTQKAWRTNMAGLYYLRQALNPDLLSIASGINIVHECEGFDFRGKFGGTRHITKMAKEFIGDYPSLHGQLMWFRTSMFINLMMSMVKPFLAKEMREKFQFGCQSGQRLDQYYLTPTPQEARSRNYARIVQALQRRYDNQAKFQL